MLEENLPIFKDYAGNAVTDALLNFKKHKAQDRNTIKLLAMNLEGSGGAGGRLVETHDFFSGLKKMTN